MILLTGASGPTGSVVLKHFVQAGLQVRAFVHRAESAAKVRAAGAAEAFIGDIEQRNDVTAAMQGVQQVYHACPRFSEREVQIVEWMIDAARANPKFRQFIYHSVLHAQNDAMPHHRDKRIAESRLLDSGLPYTILQPTQYFQVSTRDWKGIVASGEFATPFGADQKLSLVNVEDIAAAATIMATQPGWTGGCFELMSGDSYTRHEMAALMTEALRKSAGWPAGRAVHAVVEDVAHWRDHQRKTGAFSETQIARAEQMFVQYSAHGLSGGNGRVLGMILGRAPSRYADFIARMAVERPQG